MSEFWAIRKGDALYPEGVEACATFAPTPFGKPLHVEVKQPRNAQFSRLYWALCARIANATGTNKEIVSDLFKIATGHATTILSKRYGRLRLPKSISFASMDETTFREFFNACCVCMYEEWKIDPGLVSDLLVPSERAA